MTKIIERVTYAHSLVPAAYLAVVGRTSLELDDNAKRIGTALRRSLPSEAEVVALRAKHFDDAAKLWRCIVPVLMHGQEAKIKPILASMVLRGAV